MCGWIVLGGAGGEGGIVKDTIRNCVNKGSVVMSVVVVKEG